MLNLYLHNGLFNVRILTSTDKARGGNEKAHAIVWQALRGHGFHGMKDATKQREPGWLLHIKDVGCIRPKQAELLHPDYKAMWFEAWQIITMEAQ